MDVSGSSWGYDGVAGRYSARGALGKKGWPTHLFFQTERKE